MIDDYKRSQVSLNRIPSQITESIGRDREGMILEPERARSYGGGRTAADRRTIQANAEIENNRRQAEYRKRCNEEGQENNRQRQEYSKFVIHFG